MTAEGSQIKLLDLNDVGESYNSMESPLTPASGQTPHRKFLEIQVQVVHDFAPYVFYVFVSTVY